MKLYFWEKWTPCRFIILSLATGFGSGYAPFSKGTFGSITFAILFAVGAYFFPHLNPWIYVLILLAIFFIGLYVSDRFVRLMGLQKSDDQRIVIDEFLGLGIALAPLVFGVFGDAHIRQIFLFSIGFFRFFDILKPPPIRLLEKLPGALGVMLDDVLAGIYAMMVVWAISIIWFHL